MTQSTESTEETRGEEVRGEETRKGRRYVKPASRPEVERLTAGGGFDEDWIDVKRPTLEMYERVLMRGNDDNRPLMRLQLAALMVADWSFVDEAGQKLPIKYETVAGADEELARALAPLVERAGDFLVSQLSPTPKPATLS